ncbi:MAG: hypothetical protein H6719_18420 [Sandaracinaceae bacterium]|nr:hypothetical protein [Sandaracinaceae bacterium]
MEETVTGGPLSFTRYRRIGSEAELSAGLEHEHAYGLFVDMEEIDGYFVEAVDVVDREGAVVYQAYFGACGGMLVYAAGTDRMVAAAAQHHVYEGDPLLRRDLAAAYAAADPRVHEHIVFDG